MPAPFIGRWTWIPWSSSLERLGISECRVVLIGGREGLPLIFMISAVWTRLFVVRIFVMPCIQQSPPATQPHTSHRRLQHHKFKPVLKDKHNKWRHRKQSINSPKVRSSNAKGSPEDDHFRLLLKCRRRETKRKCDNRDIVQCACYVSMCLASSPIPSLISLTFLQSYCNIGTEIRFAWKCNVFSPPPPPIYFDKSLQKKWTWCDSLCTGMEIVYLPVCMNSWLLVNKLPAEKVCLWWIPQKLSSTLETEQAIWNSKFYLKKQMGRPSESSQVWSWAWPMGHAMPFPSDVQIWGVYLEVKFSSRSQIEGIRIMVSCDVLLHKRAPPDFWELWGKKALEISQVAAT